MHELVGTIIGNHYQLDELIGDGGMSFVFKATDIHTGKSSAVKILKRDITSSRVEDIFRFRREATIVSQLKHPNLARVYEVGEHGDLKFIAMELVSGRGLDKRIVRSPPIELERALAIIIQTAETLDYVHGAGIIHRDVKPANILVLEPSSNGGPAWDSNSGKGDIAVKIVDFGLSRAVDLSRIKGKQVLSGTFSYMSPEQSGIISHPVDERSDLYSLGIVFYELLTGQRPFKGKDINTIVHQQIARSPQKPSRINHEIPPVIEKIVLKLIRKDPADRYQSVQGLLQDLRACAAGRTPRILGRNDHLPKLSFHPSLTGRREQIARLQRLFQQAADGRGCSCWANGCHKINGGFCSGFSKNFSPIFCVHPWPPGTVTARRSVSATVTGKLPACTRRFTSFICLTITSSFFTSP